MNNTYIVIFYYSQCKSNSNLSRNVYVLICIIMQKSIISDVYTYIYQHKSIISDVYIYIFKISKLQLILYIFLYIP